MLEPHLDALAILAEARADGIAVDLAALGVDEDASWGVDAAEGGAARLTARQTPSRGWVREGTKPWCSLAQDVSHALVTAWTGEHDRRLFAVSMRDAAVSPHRGPWVARGLSRIVSAPVDFTAASAVPVGDDGWYLRRAGFAVGGMGVAAVWWGGALSLLAALRAGAAREGADQIAQMLLGEADALSWSARATLLGAAGRVDAAGAAGAGDDLRVLAERVRAVTATAVERIVTRSGHALGPGPLTVDEEHARRVSDLKIYLRQHHAQRDLARLGRLVAS
ncbi:acyl-CoA dehydrogenase [Microbacterium aurum]